MRAADWRQLRAAAARGAAFLGGIGVALGGIARTLDSPVFGTSFGAFGGLVAGALAGAMDGLLLAALLGRLRSHWPARAVSALVALLAVPIALAAGYGPADGSATVTFGVPLLGVLVAGAVGPLIAYGLAPGRPASAGGRVPVNVLAWQVVGYGTATGGAIGALLGGVYGAVVYWQAAALAAVIGAWFGSASGAVLGCLMVAIAVLPRMRAQR